MPKRNNKRFGNFPAEPEPVPLEQFENSVKPKQFSTQTSSLVVASVMIVHACLAYRYHDDIKEYLFGIKKK